jgi:3'-phosphoadenosine 5'-phosphosulfate sulfotransferase (PAPS reductase)/FAD synthetase
MNQVVSFSGGKDSTAMVLEMLERGEGIHSVVAFDTGWEFPEMLEHWDKFEKYVGIELVRVQPKQPFDYWLFDRPVKRKGTDEVYRLGNGWPSPMRRWCTREKVNALERYFKQIDDLVLSIGYAADEAHRLKRNTLSTKKYETRYPLIEYGIDEKKALEICKRHGFDWGGLYEHFSRVSCFCCPLQPLPELRTLYHNFPELWNKMKEWDKRCNGNNPGFYGYKTVQEMEDRFKEEDRLGSSFNIRHYNKGLIDPQLSLF